MDLSWGTPETALVYDHLFGPASDVIDTITEDIIPDVRTSKTASMDFADRLEALAREMTLGYMNPDVDGWEDENAALILGLVSHALDRVSWLEIADRVLTAMSRLGDSAVGEP